MKVPQPCWVSRTQTRMRRKASSRGVPVPRCEPETAQELPAEEAEADGEEVLLLMTTDLVHYVSLEQAEEEDPILMDHITALDVEGLYEAVQEQGLSICGEVPTAIGMEALRALGYSRFDFSKRTTSYDVSGDETRVVGYPAGAVWR